MVAHEIRMPMSCMAKITLNTVVGDTTFEIPFTKVLCVPTLCKNLLSRSQMLKNSNKIKEQFEEECCILKLN